MNTSLVVPIKWGKLDTKAIGSITFDCAVSSLEITKYFFLPQDKNLHYLGSEIKKFSFN